MTLRQALTSRPPAGAPLADRWFPFLRALRVYDSDALRRDLVAGLTVALFTIPQALAYAIIFGYPPLAGIGTAVVASILGTLFGSSEFLVNGPTNAISVMLLASAPAMAAIGDPRLVIPAFTLAMGLMQVAAAGLRLGSFTRFVSEPVLTGFTAGAGLYIVVNQVPECLGLSKAQIVTDLWGWIPPRAAVFDLARDLGSLAGLNPVSLALAVGTFGTVRLIQRLEPRVGRRLPAPFIAIVLATALSWALGLGEAGAGHKVKLVRDIETLTRTLPELSWPSAPVGDLARLWEPMLAIGVLGAVEAIAIGKSLATRAGHPFDASRQLLGEGVCNVGAALVGGFASSGSFSRTAVNFEAGAVTRISVVASGLLVLVIVLAFAPAANFIPIAALAGTLVHIGLRLVDVTRIGALASSTLGDRGVLMLTAAAVLVTEKLETALFLGVGASVVQALRRAGGFKLTRIAPGAGGVLLETELPEGAGDEAVRVVNLQGELFFAAAEVLRERLLAELDRCRVLVLRLQDAYNLDATTADALEQVAAEAHRRGGRLVLCGVRPGTLGTLRRSGALKHIGEDAVFPIEAEMLASTRNAIAWAEALVAGPPG
jgi:SulP family sulfate permease